jgi:hypothetical protein
LKSEKDDERTNRFRTLSCEGFPLWSMTRLPSNLGSRSDLRSGSESAAVAAENLQLTARMGGRKVGASSSQLHHSFATTSHNASPKAPDGPCKVNAQFGI